LRLYIDPADTFALTSSDKKDSLHVKALMFDSHNREIDPYDNSNYANVSFEWSWYSYKYGDDNGENQNIDVNIEPFVGTINDKVLDGETYN
jgi:hypothetical protein